MNVCLIGSGGREHALAYRIKKSKSLSNLFIIPGNPGMESLGNLIDIPVNDFEALTEFCKENLIDLVVVGPEQPLAVGIADYLRSKGIKVFGPDKAAADIEVSKSFSKALMKKYSIPTAKYEEFGSGQKDEVLSYLTVSDYPLVIKADGLAAGKGVIICNNHDEAKDAVEKIFTEKIFGSAGDKIVIEEFMHGLEASVFAVTDGVNFVCLPAAQDHKRVGDGDTGKNTGGMGAYAPAPLITPQLQNVIDTKIIQPTLNALLAEGRRFIGCLYAGIMVTAEGPKVVEFNCRFGDPETQVVLPLVEGDFAKLLYSAAEMNLDKSSVSFSGGSSVCVVAASGGYPDEFKKGYEIKGIDQINDDDIIVFHAGVKKTDGKIVTNGGRVLGVTSVLKENDLKKAKEKAYTAVNKICFDDIYFRHDISDKAFDKV
jgi:phosphoribosylamine---glycine ligase